MCNKCGVDGQRSRHSHSGRINKVQSVETREKIRTTLKGIEKSEKDKQHCREAAIGRGVSDKEKELKRQLWKNPEFVRKQMLARGCAPNKAELRLLQSIQSFGFTFVGDGQLVIGGKCPDFWDGGTKLIELYGDYWHRNHDPQERIDFFKQRGYDCAVIWESEMIDVDLVKDRVQALTT